MSLKILIADYSDLQQSKDITFLLDCYSRDQMGGGEGLPATTKENLITELAKIPHAITILCYVDKKPAGLVNCFMGFSTFKCKPLINIHDVIVLDNFRGQGISQQLLAKVEEIARSRDCCKITLEVLDGNKVAQNAYLKYGFSGYELDPSMGKAFFWEKPL